jgi:hypothetical protein
MGLPQAARRELNDLGIEIIPVEGKQATRRFIQLPYDLYRNDAHWVPPLRMAVAELLDKEKHPFYANAETQLYLALKDGRVVGRVAAILDRAHNRFHQESAGFFGFYESIDDAEVALALLSQARAWVKGKGAEFLRGPVNPSTNYECGMLIDGFDSDPMIMMPYNPSYYPALMEKTGLRKAKDLYAYLSNTKVIETGKIDRLADRVLASTEVRVRQIDLKNYQADVERVWEVYNSAWEKNWGFIPMSREEFMLMGKEMKMILKPELVLIGEAGPGSPGRKSGHETGQGKIVSHRAAQNTVLSTIDTKCARSRPGHRGGVPDFGPGGGVLRHAHPQRPEAGLWRL